MAGPSRLEAVSIICSRLDRDRADGGVPRKAFPDAGPTAAASPRRSVGR
jgi:hypothetical protein